MAAHGNEVEIKFRIANKDAIARLLRECGFREKTARTHEMNTLYDFPDRRLTNRGALIRIRKYGQHWTLTYKAKGQEGRHKTRREINVPVDTGEKLAQIFESVGLKPIFRYEKFRSEYEDEHGDVVLDETPIGDIGEIEGEPEWIDRTAQRLGIRESDYITASYAGLFFEWKQRTGSKAEEMTFEAVGKQL
jgi:adenylate cyclase class 2